MIRPSWRLRMLTGCGLLAIACLTANVSAAPLVVGDTMYFVTPYPNIVYALDLRQPNAAAVKWKFDPRTQPRAQGVACCDVVNRGAAYDDGRIVINTLDAQTIAIDAASGRELWLQGPLRVRQGA